MYFHIDLYMANLMKKDECGRIRQECDGVPEPRSFEHAYAAAAASEEILKIEGQSRSQQRLWQLQQQQQHHSDKMSMKNKEENCGETLISRPSCDSGSSSAAATATTTTTTTTTTTAATSRQIDDEIKVEAKLRQHKELRRQKPKQKLRQREREPRQREQEINNENVKQLGDSDYEELSSEFSCNFSSDDCDRFVRYYWDYKSGKLLSRRNNREDVDV